VPAGEHVVELRYASPTLAAGTAVSAVSYAGLVAAWGTPLVRRRREAPRGRSPLLSGGVHPERVDAR
jgi:hypothetical protein